MQVHLTAAAIELQEHKSLSVREFRASIVLHANGVNECIYKENTAGGSTRGQPMHMCLTTQIRCNDARRVFI